MILKVDGQVYRVDLPSISTRLANAKDAARRSYSISPSGFGVHWPDIDEDLTIDGLIASARPAQPKIGEAPLLLKKQPVQKDSSLREHLRRVIIHVQETRDRFRALAVAGLHTMPIPFFGDIEKAEILTVGVNPAATEFDKNRKWRETEATPEYLEERLKNYFRSTDPPFHPWFSPWEESLKMLNGASYKRHAAHLDLSPRATRAMSKISPEKFSEMVKEDLEIFFETLLLCKHVKVLLLAGCVPSVTKGFHYMNELLRESSSNSPFDLQGPYDIERGGGMSCRDTLVGPKLNRPLPVFFFSRSPSYPNRDDLIRLVAQKKNNIIDCLNNL
jgi:hypothetical protein